MTPLTPLRSTLLNNILNQFKLNRNWLKSPEDPKINENFMFEECFE